MTNTPHGQVPDALPAIQRFEVVDCIDSKHVPAVIPKPHGPWVRYEDHAAALCRLHAENEALRAQQDDAYDHGPQLAARLMAAPPQKEVQEPYGWLYDWTHSSATGKPDTTCTGFTKDEAHARKHDNCIAVFTTPKPAPATPITVEQVEDAIGLQSSAWDTIGAEKIVEAVLRLTNGQAPATQKLKGQICINDINQSAACAVGSVGTTSDAQTTHSTHDAPATQQAGEVSESIEQLAVARYKVVPAHESMFHRWAVVAGDGAQQLYLGREVECENMARKFAGAFLDGAFVAMQNAAPQPSPTAQAASSAVLKAIREANMQLVRTDDDAFMLVPYKVATAQAAESVPAPVLDSLALMKVVMQADEALSGRCTRGTTNWAAAIGKAVQDAVLAARAPTESAGRDAEDAARWRMLPAFFEEYQIDAMKLYRDIDAHLTAGRKQGGA